MPAKKQIIKPSLSWKVHTPNLLQEISENGGPGISMLKIPLNIFGKLLYNVSQRASQLNDPMLNALMMQLTLYSIADPEHEEHNSDFVQDYLRKHLKK